MHRVGAHQADPAAEAPRAELAGGVAEHAGGEVDAHDPRRAAAAATQGDGEIRRSRAEVEDPLGARQAQRADSARPPPPVEAAAQQMVEQVVAPRDGVEHRGDAIRRLVDHPVHAGKSS